GFKTWLLLLITALGDSWDLLDQRFTAIDGYRRRCVGVSENECMRALFILEQGLEAKGRSARCHDLVDAMLGGLGMTWEVYGLFRR
ncbi:hypothetical protein Tco_0300242, partial [Tanacetum coccineum]